MSRRAIQISVFLVLGGLVVACSSSSTPHAHASGSPATSNRLSTAAGQSTSRAVVPAPVTPWTIAHAGAQYLVTANRLNELEDLWELRGPATDPARSKPLAVKIVAAERNFDAVLADPRQPASAKRATNALKQLVDAEVATWESIRDATTATTINTLYNSLDSSADYSVAVKAVRSALHLPSYKARSYIGATAHNLGATVRVERVSSAISILQKDDYGNLVRVHAPQSGRYIVMKTTVTNDARVSMDLTCSYPIATKLQDVNGREFDAIDDLYKIPGNPDCNAGLQPGFSSPMTWTYLVPPHTRVTGVTISDVTDPSVTSAFATYIPFAVTVP